MTITVRPLDASRVDDFYRVHGREHGTDWCYCAAWWVDTWESWGDRSADENKALREKLFEQDQYDGYLLYVYDRPAGWCQCGRRDRLPKLLRQFKLKPDPDIWAITCLLIVPPFRKQGLTHRFLDEIMSDLERKGIRHVQAFPRRGEGLDDEDAWTGPEELYRRAGFILERDDPQKPIYGKQLNREDSDP